MPAIAIQNSFVDDERTISYYDFVHPLYKIHDAGPPELIGTCFPIGIGIYLTAAHNFDLFGAVRNQFKNQSGEKAAPTEEEMPERKRIMEETRFLEGTSVNLAPLILDQAAIRQGQLKNLGFSLPVFVSVAYDFDLAVLFVENDVRRNPEGQPKPIACLSIQETPTVGQKVVVAGFRPRCPDRRGGFQGSRTQEVGRIRDSWRSGSSRRGQAAQAAARMESRRITVRPLTSCR